MGNTQTTTPLKYPPIPTDQKSLYWWWTNSRNTNLFVSENPPFYGNPNTEEEKARDVVVFWFHGLNSHCCHVENRIAVQFLSDNGFHVYCYDQAGWGRSSSDSDRGWIADWNWWIDDGLSFIQHTMTLEENSKKNFFISGVSLGGAISLTLGLKIQNLDLGDPVWGRWAGVAVLCPAIEQTMEPAWIEIKALETAHSLGGQKLALGPLLDPDTFPSPESYQEFLNDPLCYSGRMKLGLAYQAREMLNNLIAHLSEIKFPFVVCHGDKDDLVPLSGTERLMLLSQTPEKHKTLHIIEGAKHCLLEEIIAQEAQVMAKVVEWMLVHKDRNQDE